MKFKCKGKINKEIGQHLVQLSVLIRELFVGFLSNMIRIMVVK